MERSSTYHYFEHGEITESGSSEILAIDKIIDIVLENIDSTAENIKENIKSSAVLDAQIDNWWLSSAAEYGFSSQAPKDAKHKLPTLSKVILSNGISMRQRLLKQLLSIQLSVKPYK